MMALDNCSTSLRGERRMCMVSRSAVFSPTPGSLAILFIKLMIDGG
jgi:hypothetical protein